jgi:hypothetical protein
MGLSWDWTERAVRKSALSRRTEIPRLDSRERYEEPQWTPNPCMIERVHDRGCEWIPRIQSSEEKSANRNVILTVTYRYPLWYILYHRFAKLIPRLFPLVEQNIWVRSVCSSLKIIYGFYISVFIISINDWALSFASGWWETILTVAFPQMCSSNSYDGGNRETFLNLCITFVPSFGAGSHSSLGRVRSFKSKLVQREDRLWCLW